MVWLAIADTGDPNDIMASSMVPWPDGPSALTLELIYATLWHSCNPVVGIVQHSYISWISPLVYPSCS